MKKIITLCLGLACLITLAACLAEPSTGEQIPASDSENTLVVTHRSGTTVVPVNPQNVAVFDMAILDSLDLMGLSDRVVGLPQNSIPYLVSHFGQGDFSDFGTLHEPNLEYMAGYELDLIIISGRARPFFDELSQLAPVVDLGLDNNDVRGSFLANQRYLGQIFDMSEAWEEEIASILALFDEANELSNQLEGKESLIIMHNEGNLQAFGPGGRFGVIHDVFGVPYVDAEVGINEEGESVNHGMTVNNEYIYAANPDLIFVIDRNYVVAGQNPEYHHIDITNDIINLTTAGQNEHIFVLNTEAWYLAPGGLQSMRQQVSNVIRGLQTVLGH